MTDVLLIYPKTQLPTCFPNDQPPLGLLHLAAVLRQAGFAPAIVDETVEPEARDRIRKILAEGVVCVGITALSGRMLAGALDAARFVRQESPATPIIWGGAHATVAPESTLRHVLVDAIGVGEGEIALPLMARAFRDRRPLSDIPGIGFKENGVPKLTPRPPQPYDLDTLPPLPFDLVDLSLYHAEKNFFGFTGDRALPVETSRSCAFRCAYCVQAVKNERYRAMQPATVARFLDDIIRRGVRSVSFVDDNFFVKKERALTILEAIRQRPEQLEIFVAVRADFLNALSDEELGRFRAAGVRMLGIGVESGSDRVLEHIRKRLQIATVHAASRRLAAHGIHAWFHFIVGFQGETLDDVIATYDAMARLIDENPCARVSNKKLIPTPATPLFQEMVAAGMPRPSTIEDYCRSEDLGWHQCAAHLDAQVEAWVQNTRYYLAYLFYFSERRHPSLPAPRGWKYRGRLLGFALASLCFRLRARLRWSGPGPDNLLFYLLETLNRRRARGFFSA